ncbi:hypothetical protein FQR65_LT01136 [Abscondita terminalis]|nr:hypothetical protein FQR65_LT01136 [Abscondita terminalis]
MFAVIYLFLIFTYAVSSNETEKLNDETGNYFLKYKALNGFSREESGQFELTETGDIMFVVRGVYTFRDADGNLHTRRYVSDNNGFKEIEPKIQSRLGSSAITTLQGGGLG